MFIIKQISQPNKLKNVSRNCRQPWPELPLLPLPLLLQADNKNLHFRAKMLPPRGRLRLRLGLAGNQRHQQPVRLHWGVAVGIGIGPGLGGSLSIVINQKGSKNKCRERKIRQFAKRDSRSPRCQHFISHFDSSSTRHQLRLQLRLPAPTGELTRANNQHSRISLRGSPSYS